MPPMTALKGKRVVVMGLGRFGGGVGVSRFLVEQGAQVLVTDTASEEDLRQSVAQLVGLPIRFRLGGHDEADFRDADLIVVNPAVDPRGNRYLLAAADAGVSTTTEIRLAVERLNRSRTIGITGTAGKSTTTAMIGHALIEACGEGRVHVGGNLGGSLLPHLRTIAQDHWVVLELSSFMLETLGEWSPHIAVVTNLSDNHLDRHETMSAYAAAKQHILSHQAPGDHAVLGDSVASWASLTKGTVTIVASPCEIDLLIPGRHNRLNAGYARAACLAAGVPAPAVELALRSFAGLPHRLQCVADHNGVRFFNDSKSTTPESARLALDVFEPGTVHAILGGYDKKSDLAPFARYAAERCAAIYTIGQTGPAVAAAAHSVAGHCAIHPCGELDQAVRSAIEQAKAGQVVLLSPACASWDQFEHFEARGRAFAEAVLRYSGGE